MSARRNSIILEEIEHWREEALINEAQYRTLRQRYDTPGLDLATIIKWVLVFGAIVLGGGLVLLFSDFFRTMPDLLITLLLIVFTAGFYVMGYRLVARHRQTLVYSGRALIFIGAVMTVVDLVWIGKVFSTGKGHWPILVALAAATYFAVGYLMRDLLVLTFGIIALTAWYGTETGYLSDWEAYWLGLNYPLRYIPFSLGLLAMGWWHERGARGADQTFSYECSRIYYALGLLYLLGAFWFISIMGNSAAPDEFYLKSSVVRVGAILVYSLVSIAVVLVGAKRHDRMFMAYGTIFLCIDVYTRFFEHFWNTLSKSLFFIVLGVLSLGLGMFLEYSRRNRLAEKLLEDS